MSIWIRWRVFILMGCLLGLIEGREGEGWWWGLVVGCGPVWLSQGCIILCVRCTMSVVMVRYSTVCSVCVALQCADGHCRT